jgi:hypothetical protein
MARLSGEEILELVGRFSNEIELLNLGDEMEESVMSAFSITVRDFACGISRPTTPINDIDNTNSI